MLKLNGRTIVFSLLLITTIFVLCSCSAEKMQKDESVEIESKNAEFINFKDELRDLGATHISNFFSNNITSIVATDYYITPTPKIYDFDDVEKISDFISIISKTHWSEPSDTWDASKEFTGMRFELKSGEETTTTINMLAWMVDCYGVVEIVSDGKSEIFEISESAYLDMRAFTTKKYYLHKSSTEAPTSVLCLEVKDKVLYNLDKKKKDYVSAKMRNVHYTLELLLIENVSFLKEPDSTCWELAITGHGQNVEKGAFSFYGVMEDIQEISITIKDEKAKMLFEELYEELKKACDNRDVEKIFKVHEVIHDYDYYAINYPAHYDLQPADWGGIGVYFGHLRSE